MEKVVYRSLGAASRKVISGPATGLDNAVVSVGGQKVLVITTDPVSVIPEIGPKASAWLSVHLIASDLATSGVRPEFATFDFNFPAEMTARARSEYLMEVGSACGDLGVSIVAGHTGSYPGAGFTIVGGGVMFGLAEMGGYVDPTMAREGDSVLMTKGAAIEAAAYLSASFPRYTERAVGRNLAAKARVLTRSCTVVRDARIAAKAGLGPSGVTSMHDATEGGILGGLMEMAAASRKAFVLRKERILQLAEAAAVCTAFGVDQLRALSEGTLLITCRPDKVKVLTGLLQGGHIRSAVIGTVRNGSGVWIAGGEHTLKKVRPAVDSYWKAYSRASREGLQ